MKKNWYMHLLIGIFLIGILFFFLKDFGLSWVEVDTNHAKVTINFLVPMQQEGFEQYVHILSDESTDSFDYSISWPSDHIAVLNVKENSTIKGKKVSLLIDRAPTQYEGLLKHVKVPIQFKTVVDIMSPTKPLTIASTNAFIVRFNTPMNKHKIARYVKADISFDIKPYTVPTSDGKSKEDLTAYVFTPCAPLANKTTYTITLKSGMPAQGGSILESDYNITIQTDEKPIISATYPEDGGKWVGLYPKLTLTSQTAITKAMLKLNDIIIEGKLLDPYHATFLPPQLLTPDTIYEAIFQTETLTGEVSDVKKVIFTTTSIDDKTFWIEVITGDAPIVKVYKGKELIRSMKCATSKKEASLGTYYLIYKKEVYENTKYEEGANYYVAFSDYYGFHGPIRDLQWQIKQDYLSKLGSSINRDNIMLSEEDAKWLYETMPHDAMIILRKEKN